MLVALLAGFLVWATLSFIERNQDSEMGAWQSITLVLVPALLSVVITFALALIDLVVIAPFIGLLLYIVAPLLMLRLQYEYSWGRSFAYAGIVVFYALCVEVLLGIGFAQIS